MAYQPPMEGQPQSTSKCQVLLSKGDELSEKGQFEDALSQYEAAVEVCPDSCEAWRRLSICFFNLKRYEESEDAAYQGLEATSDNALHWHLALAIGNQGRPEEALGHLDSLHGHSWIESPMVYGTRASLLQDLGRYDEALPYIKHAWRKEKNVWNAVTLAHIYLDSHRAKSALRVLRRAIRMFGDTVALNRMYAWALIKCGAYKDAEEQARKILELDATDLYGMRYEIYSTMLAGDVARAVELAEEFKSRNPDHDLNYFYGLALRRIGRIADALAALDTIDPHVDDLPEWLFERGMCYVGLDYIDEGKKILDQLSTVNLQFSVELRKVIAQAENKA